MVDLGYDTSTLRGRYILFGAMKKKMMDLSLLPMTTRLMEVNHSGHNPITSPLKLPLEIERLEILEPKPFKTYQLRPEESLLDVSRNFDIKLTELVKINNIDPESPPPPGAEIRLE